MALTKSSQGITAEKWHFALKFFGEDADKLNMKDFVRRELNINPKSLLVNPRFQKRFIAFSIGAAVGACVLFYAGNCYFFYMYEGAAIDVGFAAADPFFKILVSMEDGMNWIFGVVAIATISLTALASWFFSHQISKPLVQLRKHFDRVARGETLANIPFRQDDYFDDLAEAYNRQMTRMRGEISAKNDATKTNKDAA